MTSPVADLRREESDHDIAMLEARRLLQGVFGFHDFRGAQAEIVGHVLNGGDALVLMPTGGGKSLCYQLPALVRKGLGLVVSPLIALMQDQVDALAQLGVRAAFLNSSLEPDRARAVERDVRAGALDLLYVAPERLLTERFLDLIGGAQLALFAIDEAHCVSQWGHDFRPEYRQLSVLHERFPGVPRLALTATADPITRSEIITQLGLHEARVFTASFDRPNIRYRVVEKGRGSQALLDFLRAPERQGQAGIVYVQSRQRVEATAALLVEQGFRSLPYHAGMDQDTRRRHQQRFLREDGIVMVATVAFGMGIDKPDVRFVVHLDLPSSLEAYYQETGRAGRDGTAAEVWMSYSLGDIVHLHQRIVQSEASEMHKRVMRQKLDAMLGYCESVECRRVVLLHYFGEKIAPCGNCDVCLDPPETWDGKVAAQKLLSAAARTGQRFGAGYLIDVLQGKDTDRILMNGHDRLPTFGVGKDMTDRAWRGIARQLVAGGMLCANVDEHGALQLTEKGREVLKGLVDVRLRRVDEKPSKKRRGEVKAVGEAAAADIDLGLFDALRAARKQLAEAQNVPAFVIFHDSVLREIALCRPTSLEALRVINGIGDRKLASYGAVLLEVIRKHAEAAGNAEALAAG